ADGEIAGEPRFRPLEAELRQTQRFARHQLACNGELAGDAFTAEGEIDIDDRPRRIAEANRPLDAVERCRAVFDRIRLEPRRCGERIDGAGRLAADAGAAGNGVAQRGKLGKRESISGGDRTIDPASSLPGKSEMCTLDGDIRGRQRAVRAPPERRG